MTYTPNNRREFLQASLAAGAALTVAGAGNADDASSKGLPTRPLGKTGERVSIICLGGWHIGSVKDESEAIKIMHTALDEGLTFFDNAWDYHDGGSEEIMGKALSMDGKRKQCFLMTKNCGRDAKTIKQHLDDSLRRLQTDHIDLVQFHEINYDNDPDWILDRGGLAEMLKAQKAGKVRYLGFTGHKDPRIHLEMLTRYNKWDTVQMPINICDYFYRSFQRLVVPEANKRGVAAIGMKSLGGGNDHKGRFIAAGVCTAAEARRYALNQDIASLVCGIDSMEVLKQDIGIARDFKRLSEEELNQLRNKVKAVAGDGRHERFKSTQLFDGPYHRQQHGLTQKEVEGT
ncbi:MAG TPA: aldo/keto reductase [Gemmataceae bacterium]|jgi:aryl-alcohol dehydrogenase-like predicted oxidoreductase